MTKDQEARILDNQALIMLALRQILGADMHRTDGDAMRAQLLRRMDEMRAFVREKL